MFCIRQMLLCIYPDSYVMVRNLTFHVILHEISKLKGNSIFCYLQTKLLFKVNLSKEYYFKIDYTFTF
jgi:hypothetical protein